jgi:thiamine kinase-like enzyme
MTSLRTRPTTVELRAEIERTLTAHSAGHRRVVTIARRPSEYQTTSPMEELEVGLNGGTSLHLLLKDLSPLAVPPAGRHVKPRFVQAPVREIEIYRTLLAPTGIGAAFYGAIADSRVGRYWLLVERMPGVELYEIGETEVWQAVARWLARMHERFRSVAGAAARAAQLLRYEPSFYRVWLERALNFARGAPKRRDALHHIAKRHDDVIERLADLRPTVIHGEFHPSNILVDGKLPRIRVYPIDWEMAGLGPGLVDLAALAAGWPERQRAELAEAYRNELISLGGAAERDRFVEGLACCRIHVALKWLGWSRSWVPPPQHTQDWLGEALGAIDELKL